MNCPHPYPDFQIGSGSFIKQTFIMRTNALKIAIILMIIISCDVSRSVNKDLQTGLVTRGNGLSCENVTLSIGDQTIHRHTFIYGEELFVNFNNMEGFEKENGRAFPGMQLLVITDRGDTALQKDDLYAGLEQGTDVSTILLQAKVTMADPIHSNRDHTLHINIWDKKGEGTFQAKLEFDVVPDEKIEIESNQLSFKEAYLFSREKGRTITGDQASLNEHIYMIFEGLEGFEVEGGKVLIGLGMRIVDASGEVILNEEDLIGDTEMEFGEVHTRLSPNFILSGAEAQNPVAVDISIWDKRGEGRIKASIELNME